MLPLFSYLPLLPILANHPKLVQAFSDNLDDAQRFFSDVEVLIEKHKPFVETIKQFTPEIQEFIAEAYPIVQAAR